MKTINRLKALILLALLLAFPSLGFSTTWFAALPSGITCTTTNTSASIAATNTFVAGDVVYFTAVQTPFTANTVAYYVIATGLSGRYFEVSTTYGGSAVTATASGSMTAVGHSVDLIAWAATQGASCASSGTALTWPPATGDILNYNGCTNGYVTADPGSASVQVTLTNDATNTGGGFVYPTAANATLHANVTGVSAAALTITGSTGGGTISGNILGGGTSSVGVTDQHSSVTVNVIGNITAGSTTTSNGYYLSGSGSLIVTGDVVLGSATVPALSAASSGNITLNGNCIGSDTVTGQACNAPSTGSITITGSLFNGKKGTATAGLVYFTPAAGNCVTYPSAAGGALQTSCPSSVTANITQMVPALTGGLGTTSHVASGVTYGGFSGTASGGASQHNTGFVQ